MQNPFRSLFERRSAIGSSYDLLQYLLRGSTSRSGAAVNESTAFNVMVVWTCISLISRTLMTLPVDVFERLEGGRRREAREHPLVRLFDTPNSWQDWPTFVQMMQVHLLLRGNAYAWINWTTSTRDGSQQATEMIPLHPDRVKVEQAPDWSLRYTLTRQNGQQIAIPADEVMHLRGLSTDGYMGRSPLQDWRESLGEALTTQEFAGEHFGHDATPPIVLMHKSTLSPTAKTNLETSWEQNYGSGHDKRRVAVLEEGMEIKQLSFNPRDSQFLETRAFQRSEIAGAFHVPPHMIGDTQKSTSWGTGIEQQKLGYLTFTIQPWLTVWEHGIKRALILNPNRFYVKFKVEGLLRGDSRARADFYERMFRIGVFSINQILALEDMDPVEGGDARFVPLNFAPLDKVLAGDVTPDASTASAAASTAVLQELLDRLRREND